MIQTAPRFAAASWAICLGFALTYALYVLSSTYKLCQHVCAAVPPFSWFLSGYTRLPEDYYVRNAAALTGGVVVLGASLMLVRNAEFRRRRRVEFVFWAVGWLLLYPISFALNLLSHL
jgi:hypothetical protein